MDISKLLLERQKSLFVGREEELRLLQQTLSDPDWHLLNIHGPGGIGKTTLIRLFAQTLDPARCFYFDGHSGFQRPDDYLFKVREALLDRTYTEPSSHAVGEDQTEISDLLNQYAVQQQGVMLFLDTFEQFGAIENWLRDNWLFRLNPLVKVCIAGRYALDNQWMHGGWNLLVKNVELHPFSSAEVQAYAHSHGIENRHIVDSLQRFSGGVPLALSISCEIIARQGKTNFLDLPQQDEMVGYLAAELTNDINDASLQQLAEAASVIWKFDQELMQSVLQEDIPTERFREFCRLPFVIRQEGCWMLHDSVRQWIFTDLRGRMPRTFRHYRIRALATLREREAAQPDKKSELAFEKLYLHEDDFVRSFCFQWDDRLAFRECKEQDFAQIEYLYLKYLHSRPYYIPGDLHLEQMLRQLWKIDSSAFFGLWKDDQLVAFSSCIPLTERAVRIFREHPITAPATSQYDPKQRQCLICISGTEPQLENKISGSLANGMAKIIDQQAYIINLLSESEWESYLPLLGYERMPVIDSSSPLGTAYRAYQLDLRTEQWSSRVDRIFKSFEDSTPVIPMDVKPEQHGFRLPLEEAVKLVQRALKHYSRLPLQPEMIDSLLPLLPDANSGRNAEWIGQQLQETIQEVLQSFADGSKEERRFYQILRYAYIQKIGSHDIVAEYLNIPSPSYYKYLRSAVRKLAYEIIKPRSIS